jgi:hypothetical protein
LRPSCYIPLHILSFYRSRVSSQYLTRKSRHFSTFSSSGFSLHSLCSSFELHFFKPSVMSPFSCCLRHMPVHLVFLTHCLSYTMIAASCLDVRALILPCFILRSTSFAVQTHCSPFPRHWIDETLEKIGKQAFSAPPQCHVYFLPVFSHSSALGFGVLFLGAAFMSLPVSLLTRQAVLFRYCE